MRPDMTRSWQAGVGIGTLWISSMAACGTAEDLLPELGDTDPTGSSSSPDDPGSTSGDPDATGGNTESTGTDDGPDPDSDSSGSVPECAEDLDCSAQAPACVDGRCEPCDAGVDPNAACAATDPTLPVCDQGTCVACTEQDVSHCGGAAPTCDPETSQCVECRFHADCPGTACDLEAGTCFTAAETMSIGYQGVADYWPMITQTVAQIPEGERRALILDGPPQHWENVVISGDRTVALIRSGSGNLGPIDNDQPVLRIEGGARVYVHEVTTVGTMMTTSTVELSGGGLWLDECGITSGFGWLVSVDGGGQLHMRNSAIRGWGPSTGIYIADGSADILYSTIIGREIGGHGVSCNEPSSSVTIRNSLVFGESPAAMGVDCDNAVVTRSALTGPAPVGGVGNVEYEFYSYNWFTCDTEQGSCFSFGLDQGGQLAFDDVARWELGDPGWDVSGDPRPGVPGSPDYAGVDVPVP